MPSSASSDCSKPTRNPRRRPRSRSSSSCAAKAVTKGNFRSDGDVGNDPRAGRHRRLARSLRALFRAQPATGAPRPGPAPAGDPLQCPVARETPAPAARAHRVRGSGRRLAARGGRGRLPPHKRFGEALGILAGDALLAAAFHELTRLAERGVAPRRVVEATRVLARAAGGEELVGGQALDLAAEGRRVTGAQVRAIHRRKTAALIAASLTLGGIAGGGTAPALRALAHAGRDLGLAFQIEDDLLNRVSTLRVLG